MDKKTLRPETLMMSHGYKPELSEGAVKCPIFQTSTFAFKRAEDGKAFFEVAYGLREKAEAEETGLIYSRINNPDLEILEQRLALWDEADECAVFESGMSAITTVLLEFLSPGDVLLHSAPLYGGTDHFIQHFLPRFGIKTLEFIPGEDKETIEKRIYDAGFENKIKFIFIESPANPTNALVDIEMCRDLTLDLPVKEHVYIAVDNTYMGPLWQQPLKLGADFSIYSATKYIGGHSDVIAGAVCGFHDGIKRVRTLRTFLGNMAGPWTGWLLLRSLETLKVRMEQQCRNAEQVALFLSGHQKVKKVYYLGLLEETDPQYNIYKKQHSAPGAMLSFDVKGGEAEAFAFLNNLTIFKLAVSLGSTESLAQHPYTMTHAGCDPAHNRAFGISESLIRLSIGIENCDDIIADITHALSKV